MRIELLVLSVLAAGALAALVDSARRAARDGDASVGSPTAAALLRASIEDLERERASIDDHGPRLLLVLGGIAAFLALGFVSLACAELSAVLIAVALGLTAPGVSWSRDQRRRAGALTGQIAELRARLESRERRPMRAPIGRGA